MKLRGWGMAVCAALLLTVTAKQAHALWRDYHVTPLNAAGADGRTLRVTVTDAGQMKECRVTVLVDPQSRLPIRKWSNGTLTWYGGGSGVKPKTIAPFRETRAKDRVTYVYRVSREQLPDLRFDFWDSHMPAPEILGGGTLFWFMVKDFLITAS